MSDPAQVLRDFEPGHGFFIGIDSDGCVFDSMEIKQKECFAPMFVKHHGLQAVSKYARQVWEFVNLYSKNRGINRFPALVRALGLLRERHEAQDRDAKVPSYPALDEWIARETKLGNATLATEVERGNNGLAQVKVWSDAVNAQIAEIVHGVPPFPLVRDCLSQALGQADLMVISQTPCDALEREWAEHDLARFVQAIAGQEMGTKTEHLQFATTGKYPADKVLMIGDAPGDHKAAKANGVLFYPILPGREEASWKRLHSEALGRFFDGTYAGDYEASLFAEFDASLPEHPSW